MKYSFSFFSLFVFIASCTQSVQKQPNIIFIMSDDHAVQAISAYGHDIGKVAPTSNIDRIAKNGAIFTKSFVTNSICGPSRAVILTGKHSHINGFRQNDEKFNGDQPTLPKILQSIGYQTAIIGKWHLHGYPQGFDYWAILNDQGTYYNPQFIYKRDTLHINKARIDTTAHWNVEMGDTAKVIGYATNLITEKALSWLDKQRDEEKPFYMMVHHKAPHRNWMSALRHVNKYDSVTFPLPETYYAQHDGQKAAQEQLQTIYKDMYEGHDLKMSKHKGSPELAHDPWKDAFNRMTPEQRSAWNQAYQKKNDAFHDANLHGKDLYEWKFQRYMQEYMATVASVDESVGRLLDYLEENDLMENTLVVYTSDQGFYLGEKGMFDKRFMYEESFRMPLLIQYPKLIEPGSIISALVQNLDFAPTFLDLAGAPNLANEMQGVSFKEVLSGKKNAFKDVLYYHYYDYPNFHMVKKHYGVQTEHYKLIHFYDDIDTWEFYDMELDPLELTNQIDNPNYYDDIIKMHAKLDSVQQLYKVTDYEFTKAPKEKVDRMFKLFKRLRGKPIE